MEIYMKVEIPKGSSNKIEYNLLTKELELDRVLAGAMFYPEEYGFVPKTLDYDGDPLDVICLTNQSTFPGCKVPIRIIGVLKMIDGGEEDDKILAVNAVDPRLKKINSLKDVSEEKKAEIKNFFLRYKELENKKVVIKEWENEKKALKVLLRCQKLYLKFIQVIEKGISKEELIKMLNKQKEFSRKKEMVISSLRKVPTGLWLKKESERILAEEMEEQDKLLEETKKLLTN